MQNILSFNEKIGYRKQPAGFATKSIHSGQNPDQWKSRFEVFDSDYPTGNDEALF